MSDPSLFIDGKWRDAADGGTREIRCPADGTPVRTVSEGGADDAVAAVLSARRAFDNGPWPRTPAPERAALLHRLADRLESDKDEVARRESLDTGKRFVESQIDVDDIVGVFRHFASLAQAESGRVVDPGMPDVRSRVVHEPVGVCSALSAGPSCLGEAELGASGDSSGAAPSSDGGGGGGGGGQVAAR